MKNIRKIILMILVVVSFITSMNILNVEAKTAPSSITLKPKSSLYYYDKGTDYISGYNFYRKQLTTGTYAYCVSNIKTSVPANMTLASKGAITDKGLDYIIKNGWPNKTMTGDDKKDYYITQSAIWEYFDETRGSTNWHSTSFTASSTGMKAHVYNLVQGAKVANKASDVVPSMSVTVPSTTMTLNNEKNYFVSSPVNVNLTNTTGTYTVVLENAPKGTILKNASGVTKTTFNKDETFTIYVPVSSVNVGTSGSVTLKVKATGVTYVTYYYSNGNKTYQDIAPTETYEVTKEIISAPLTLNFSRLTTKVKISKQDITTKKELPGAMLSIKDKNGKVIEQWVSTNEPHYIEGLEPGVYTLGEAIAPDGYILSNEEISFTVRDDGSVTSVVMYNAKETKQPTKVKISKQDITTKQELPGATLVVKDKDGNIIDEWVSTNEPHYIENLKVGEYTLTEKIAPAGYILSEETIKFTVKEDGKVTSVIMYNAKETKVTKVKVSKQDITTKQELPGATLVIKDKDGNIIDEWVSTSDPHYIEGLKPGEYTLTEKIAPEGYTLSEETIKFTVKEDGTLTSVVMYNSPAPYVEVPKTDLNVSSWTAIIAGVLITLGTGMVVYYVKYTK